VQRFSIIIPVFNRPQELKELLESLSCQTYKNFEVIIVEDGSSLKADKVVEDFKEKLEIRYYYKPNSGQGFSRNYGYERASGDYFIVFDSDCLIPEIYLELVNRSLNINYLDAYGGPDREHASFSPVQKAISYAMTSIFSTGGIRGGKKRVGIFHPRSFNMGISRQVFEETGGYILPKMGEDLELSIRIIKKGFKVGLIPEAFVFHKRRTSFNRFFQQLHFFGRARINVFRHYPNELKITHFFPAIVVLSVLISVLLLFFNFTLFAIAVACFFFYSLLLIVDASIKNKSILIGFLSLFAVYTMLFGYGIGFITEGVRQLIHPKKGVSN